MKFTKTLAAAAGVGLVAAGLLSAAPASADPSGTPAGGDRALVGVGSDTTQNVMNDLADVVTIGGVKQIASWDAIGSGSFTTRTTLPANALNCSYTRSEANGSSAGRSRLLDSLTTGNARTGCLDFARSSSARAGLNTLPSMTWIPFAKDTSTYVTRADGNVSRVGLTLTDVQNVFKCLSTGDGTWPVLPQTGSGSRAFWLSQMGPITEAQIDNGTYSCLVPVGTVAGQKGVTAISRASNVVTATVSSAVTGLAVGNNVVVTNVSGFSGTFSVSAILTSPARIQWTQNVADATGVVGATSFAYKSGSIAGIGRAYQQENDGRSLKVDEMMPFSVGLFNTQAAGANADVRGNLNVLSQIGDNLPVQGNASFPVARDLYNIIPTAKVIDGVTDAFDTVFIGSNSLICQNTSTIAKNGFAPSPSCGNASDQS